MITQKLFFHSEKDAEEFVYAGSSYPIILQENGLEVHIPRTNQEVLVIIQETPFRAVKDMAKTLGLTEVELRMSPEVKDFGTCGYCGGNRVAYDYFIHSKELEPISVTSAAWGECSGCGAI